MGSATKISVISLYQLSILQLLNSFYVQDTVLSFGPPGTGKALCAWTVAHRTDACFVQVTGSELVLKYVGERALMVCKLFEMARTKNACLSLMKLMLSEGLVLMMVLEETVKCRDQCWN